MELFLVALGGALGAVCRYLAGNAISKAVGSALPWGTFLINLGGCFAMGLLMTVIVEPEICFTTIIHNLILFLKISKQNILRKIKQQAVTRPS